MLLTKPQQVIVADLADDHYGLWEIPGTLRISLDDVDDERELQLIALQALRGLLEDGWVEFYETHEPHGSDPSWLTTERALSVMDEHSPWVTPSSRDRGPYVHVAITPRGLHRYFGTPPDEKQKRPLTWWPP